MGLINEDQNEAFYSPYIENYYQDNQNVPTTDEDDSDQQSLHNHSLSRQRNRPARHHISVSQENLSNFGRKRGVRRTRRVDNLRYLLNLEEKDEDVLAKGACGNFEPCSSLFEELLENPEKMKAWNSFVESSEEDQWHIVNYRGLHDIKEDNEEELDNGKTVRTAEEDWIMVLDERNDHPAYTPRECYNRVDRNLKALLRRRQLPLGMLANLEREIITFFHEYPKSIYIYDISSSYERMLLHALCQYLNLSSQSYDDDTSRKTQVENKSSHFRPPSLLLSEYLQRYQHSL